MNDKNLKILVTGANGYIGSLLCEKLNYQGYTVVGTDSGLINNDCTFYENNKGLTRLKKDIRNIEADDLKGFYAICHFAALSNDPLGEVDKTLTYDINYKATINLLDKAIEAGVQRFIFSSSCSMYGITDQFIVDENSPIAPLTAYAESKFFVERNLREKYSNKDINITVLRNSTAYGVSPMLRIDLVVNNLTGWAILEKKIKIMSDGTPWRPLIHVEDIANAFIAVIESPEKNIRNAVFNVGVNEENYQVKDIADIIKQFLPDCEIVYTGENGADSRSYKVNFDKIKEGLPNFKPVWDLKKGIIDLIEKYQTYNLSHDDFLSRKYIRLKQVRYMMDNDFVDNKLFLK